MTSSKAFSFNVSAVIRFLGCVIAFLLVASVGTQILKYVGGRANAHGLVPMFYVDIEMNVPAFFSALQLLFAALLLAIIASGERREGRSARDWIVLAAGFFLMSVDEVFSYHERLAAPMKALIGAEKYGLFAFAWVIPAIAMVVCLGCYFIPFLARLPKSTRWEFIFAGALYVGGAVGFELLGGRHYEMYGGDSFSYTLYVTCEEALEMVGVLAFIRALLRHMAGIFGAVVVDFSSMRPVRALVPVSCASVSTAHSGSEIHAR